MPIDSVIGKPRGVDDLDWFVGWRPWVWNPAVRHVVGSPERFRGKRVLELGFCTGKMSCYFGLLGATVLGVDLSYSQPEAANALARDLNLAERVSFRKYDGNLAGLGDGQWDFVFTKSVLVLLPIEQAAPDLRRLLKPGGQYLACENCVLPFGLNRLRKHPYGVDQQTLNTLQKHFSNVESKRHYGLVSSIVATY
jgi:SAM-dependent methyltransferase